MSNDETTVTDHLGMLVFFLSSLIAIFIGPLEAALAIGIYWIFGPDSENTASQ